MSDLPVDTPLNFTFGYDIKKNDKNAIDYITYYNHTDDPSHNLLFDHDPETIDPTYGVTGVDTLTTYYAIPVPNSTLLASGYNQPSASFLNVSADHRRMTLFGGTITDIIDNFQLGDSAAIKIYLEELNGDVGITDVRFDWKKDDNADQIEIHFMTKAEVDFDILRGNFGPDGLFDHTIPSGLGGLVMTGTLGEMEGSGTFTLTHPELGTFSEGRWTVECAE